MDTKTILAKKLLAIKAIRLSPEKPFTWASGWKSPFYCDNRKTLSYPSLRTFVKLELARIVAEQYPAEELALPFVYVRSKAKDHGMGNQIEGQLPENAQVVVVEDLISTGGSSLAAVAALRAAGCNILGMVASYTYGFDVARKAFEDAQVTLTTLTDYHAVVAAAVEEGYIRESDLDLLHRWRSNPSEWTGK